MIPIHIQQELVEDRLAVRKLHETHGGNILALYKYHRRVMYDYLWFKNPDLRECRGHVYDYTTGELVQAAPIKTFNYGENGWWNYMDLDTDVKLYKKFNGFMACSTIYDGERLYTTTGSFSGEYQQMAQQEIERLGVLYSSNYTDLFEIIADFDPHIVDEGPQRAVYLGSRVKATGQFKPAPSTLRFEGKLRDALMFAREDKGEGFMMYAWNDFDFKNAAKLKTPYYVGKKTLMRMGPARVKIMYNNVRVDGQPNMGLPDMYDPIAMDIVKNIREEDWVEYDDQVRRKYIESAL